MIRTQEHYATLRDTIGRIGFYELLEALSEIAESHADVQTKNNLSPGASKSLSAGLSELAERYAVERDFEIQNRK